MRRLFMKSSLTKLKNKLKTDGYGYYIDAMVIVGLPAIAYIYSDWRAALAVFVIANITLGVLSVRNGGSR